jgi:hypothetical protein
MGEQVSLLTDQPVMNACDRPAQAARASMHCELEPCSYYRTHPVESAHSVVSAALVRTSRFKKEKLRNQTSWLHAKQ